MYVDFYEEPDCADKTVNMKTYHKTFSTAVNVAATKTADAMARTETHSKQSQKLFTNQLQIALLISVATIITLAVTCVGVNCMVSRLNKTRLIVPK